MRLLPTALAQSTVGSDHDGVAVLLGREIGHVGHEHIVRLLARASEDHRNAVGLEEEAIMLLAVVDDGDHAPLQALLPRPLR